METQKLIRKMVEEGKVELNEQDTMNVMVGFHSFLHNVSTARYFSFGVIGQAVNGKEDLQKNIVFMVAQAYNHMERLHPVQSRTLVGVLNETVKVISVTDKEVYDKHFDARTKKAVIELGVSGARLELLLVQSFGETKLLVQKLNFVQRSSNYAHH